MRKFDPTVKDPMVSNERRFFLKDLVEDPEPYVAAEVCTLQYDYEGKATFMTIKGRRLA